MSKLNIDQKSVKALFSEKKADFLIPDYQRPYAWGEKECHYCRKCIRLYRNRYRSEECKDHLWLRRIHAYQRPAEQ